MERRFRSAVTRHRLNTCAWHLAGHLAVQGIVAAEMTIMPISQKWLGVCIAIRTHQLLVSPQKACPCQHNTCVDLGGVSRGCNVSMKRGMICVSPKFCTSLFYM